MILPIRNFDEKFLGVVLGFFFFAISVILSGCSKTPTSTLEPAQTQASKTADPSLFPNLKTPTVSIDQPELSQTPVFSSEPYLHPNGLFSIPRPLDWTIESTDSTALLTNADGSAKILFQVINTGTELEAESFERLMLAREKNVFAAFPDYLELSRQFFTGSGAGSIQKSLTDNNVPKTVQSWYYRLNSTVYSVDLWANQDIFERTLTFASQLLNQLEFTDQATTDLEIYQDSDGFKYETDFFSLQLPSTWEAVHTSGDFAHVDTFTSPDRHAFVQAVVYDDGESISNSVAGSFALILLNNYYSQDLEITSDIVLPDWREHLAWYSKSAGYRGDSYIEINGTAFVLFTTGTDAGYEEIYSDMLEKLVNSYH